MADKTVGMLANVPALDDTSLLPVEQGGELMNLSGKQIREFVSPYADSAAINAEKAVNANTFAQSALTGINNAIKKIPSGSTPIVNDLTTGGSTMALSAEMGKKLGGRTNIGTYTSLDQIGLTDAEMNPEDLGANLDAICTAAPSVPFMMAPDETTNLTASLGAKLAKDTGYTTTYPPRMWITRFGGKYSPARIDAVYDYSGFPYVFTAQFDKISSDNTFRLRPFIVSYTEIGFQHASGSYVGNGDATSRTVNMGGPGSVAMIWSEKGKAIICGTGGISSSLAGVNNVTSTNAKIVNGVLSLKTDDALLNANGVTYNYQVL